MVHCHPKEIHAVNPAMRFAGKNEPKTYRYSIFYYKQPDSSVSKCAHDGQLKPTYHHLKH